MNHFNLVIIFLLLSVNAIHSKEQNNHSNVFEGSPLNFLINFRFRPDKNKVDFPNGSREYQMLYHEPRVFDYFDWVIWRFLGGDFHGDESLSPRSVLLYPNSIEIGMEFIKKLPILNEAEQRLLVMAGEDTHLSNVLQRIRRFLKYANINENVDDFFKKRFSNIFFEAKNIHHEFIKAVPMGFTNFYILLVSPSVINDRIKNAASVVKSGLAFAAWGHVWAKLDKYIDDRKKLAQFLENNSTQQWVSRVALDFDDYWNTLGMYKYSLCPHGNGIQAPKIFEALVLRVVPIVTRIAAFEDLVELGFPILIIDDWEDLTPEFLTKEYNRSFQHVEWSRVLRMITVDGIWTLLMNGQQYPF